MANIAFIDTYTTLNDLYGSHNCPFMFRYEIWEEFQLKSQNSKKSSEIWMVPDENILGNGTAYHKITNDIVEENKDKWLSLEDGLEKIYNILSVLNKNNVYIVGYGIILFDLKILNEHFERILHKPKIEFDNKFIIDVEELAKILVDVRECGNYSKNSVISTLRCDINDEEVSSDISETRTLLLKLMELGNFKTIRDVSDFIHSPHDVKVFQQGKYKGRDIYEVFKYDRQYFSWIMKNRKFYEGDKNLLVKVESILNSEDA